VRLKASRCIELQLLLLPFLAACGHLKSRPETVPPTESGRALSWPVRFEPVDESTPRPLPGGGLVFVSSISGNRDLWLLPQQGTSRRLTSHSADDFSPAPSYDGRLVAFVSRRDDAKGDLFLLELSSGKLQRLTDESSGDGEAGWFPDNHRLVFYSEPQEAPAGLYLLDIASGEKKLLLAGSYRQPAPSPDGSLLALVETPGSTTAVSCLRLLRLSDGRVFDLDDCSLPAAFPAWVEAGGKIALVFSRFADDSDGNGRIDVADTPTLWLASLEVANPSNSQLFPLTSGSALEPATSGDIVYFSARNENDLDIMALRLSLPTIDCRQALESYRQAQSVFEALRLLRFVSDAGRPSADSCLLAQGRLLLEWGRLKQAGELFSQLAASAQQEDIRRQALAGQLSAAVESELPPAASTPSRRAQIAARAQAFLKDLEAIGLDETESVLLRADIIRRTGDFFTALSLLEHVPAEKAAARRLRLQAEILAALGQPEAALERLLELLRLPGASPTLLDWALEQTIRILERPEPAPTWPEDTIDRLELAASRLATQPQVEAALRLAIAKKHLAAGRFELARRALVLVREARGAPPDAVVEAIRRLAEMSEAEGRLEEALQLASELVNRYPDQAAASRAGRNLVKRLALRHAAQLSGQNEPGLASKAVERLIELDPENLPAWRYWLELQAVLGRSGPALAEVKKRLDGLARPDLACYLEALALTYIDPPSNFSKAKKLVEKALSIDPQVPFYHQTLGWLVEQQAFRQNRADLYSQAADHYETALSLIDAGQEKAALADLLLNLGNVHLQLRNYEQAWQFYHRRSELDFPLRHLRRELIFWENLGRSAFNTSRFLPAARAFERAEGLAGAASASRRLSRLTLARAVSLTQAGQFPDADAVFEQACNLAKKQGESLILRRCLALQAQCNWEAGNHGRAARLFLQARTLAQEALRHNDGGATRSKSFSLSISPRASRAPLGLEPDEELDWLDAWLARLEEKAGAWLQARERMAARLERLQQTQLATEDSRLWLDLAYVGNQLAGVVLTLGDAAEAARHFRQALEAARQSQDITGQSINLLNLCLLYLFHEQGDAKKLAQENEQLERELSPGATRIRLMLARAALWLSLALKKQPPPRNLEDILSGLDGEQTYLAEARQVLLAAWQQAGEVHVPAELMVNLAYALGRVLWLAGDDQSYSWFERAAELAVRERILSYFWQADDPHFSLEKRLRWLEQLSPQVATTASSPMAQQMRDGIFLEAASRAVEAGQALRLVDRLLARRRLDEYWPRLEQLFGPPAGEFLKQLAAKYQDGDRVGASSGELERQVAAAGEFLNHAFPAGAAGRELTVEQPPEAEVLQAALADGESLLVVIPQGDEIRLLWFTQRASESLFLSGAGQWLRQLDLIWNGTAGQQQAARQNLSHLFLEPLGDRLSKSRKIYFVDGLTPRLPLEVLAHNGKPLLGTLPICRIYAPRDLLLWKRNLEPELAGAIWLGPSSQKISTLLAEHFGEVTPAQRPENLSRLLAPQGIFVSALPLLANAASSLGDRWASDDLAEQVQAPELLEAKPPASGWWITPRRNQPVAGAPADIAALAGEAHSWLMLPEKIDLEKFLARLLPQLKNLAPDRALSVTISDFIAAGQDWRQLLGLQLRGCGGLPPEAGPAFAGNHREKLTRQAAAALEKRDFRAAISHLVRLVRAGELLGDQQTQLAASRLLVQAALQEKDYGLAEKFQLRLLKAAHAQDNLLEQAKALRSLGVISTQAGNHRQAAEWLDRSCRLFEQAGQTAALADTLATLALARDQANDFEAALEIMERARSIFHQLGDGAQEIRLLRLQGTTFLKRLHRLEQARERYRQALELAEGQNRRELQLAIMLDLVRCETAAGNYRQAVELAERTALLAEQGKLPALQAEVELEKAKLSWYLAEYQQATRWRQKALELARQAGAVRLEISALSLGGLINLNVGQLAAAEEQLLLALEAARRAGFQDEEAVQLSNLGLVARKRGELSQAIELFRAARDIDQRAHNRSGLAYDLRHIGLVHLAAGRPALAARDLKQAATISEELGERFNQAHCLLGLAQTWLKMKEYSLAAEAAVRAVEMARALDLKELLWQALEISGRLARRQGQLKQARQLYELALAVVEKMQAGLQEESLRSGFISDKSRIYERLVELLLEMKDAPAAFSVAEKARRRGLTEMLAAGKMRPSTEAKLSQAPQAAPLEPVELEQLSQLIPSHSALYYTFVTSRKTIVWLVKKDGYSLFVLPFGQAELKRRVDQFRSRLDMALPLDEDLEDFYRLLIEPVRGALTSVETILLAAHGPLIDIPFAALKVPGGGWWADEFDLIKLPSAEMWLAIRQRVLERTGPPGPLLAAADPFPGGEQALPFARLEAEVALLEAGGGWLLSGEQLTEAELAKYASQAGIIHLATHGEADGERSGSGALLIRQPGAAPGWLAAADVLGLQLEARLVVLSACRSALSADSISLAFLIAGADTVLAALWPVPDVTGALLIKHFYRQLKQHQPARALRLARIWLRERYPHPRYWAAIELQGWGQER